MTLVKRVPHRLRRTREAVLEAGAALGRLVGVSLDEVRHAVLWTSAVHHLLRRVVRVRDVRPRDVAEILAPLQLSHRFARLEYETNTLTYCTCTLDVGRVRVVLNGRTDGQ